MDVCDVCIMHLIQDIPLFLLFNLVNIGQNSPGNNNTPTQQTAPSQTSGINVTQQTTGIPGAVNFPGVAAGNLDFSNFARSLGNMVQGFTGQFGATLVNPNSATGTSTVTTSTSSSSTQNSNSSTNTTTTTNNNENDTVTEQMLGGEISRLVCISQMRFDFYRTCASIGRWY